MKSFTSRIGLFAGLLVLWAAPSSASAQCATGTATWRSHTTHEYFVCSNTVQWQVARSTCNATTADNTSAYYLARPNDGTENGAMDGWIGFDVWIGANDLDSERGSSESGWVFTLGLANSGGGTATYENFSDNIFDNQPDNDTSPCGSQGEDCVEMWSNGVWNDDRCFCNNNGDNVLNGYICEGDPRCGNGVHASTEACDDGNLINGDGCSSTCTIENLWTCNTAEPSVCSRICTPVSSLGSSTYCAGGSLATPSSVTWDTAQAACVSAGGNLVAVNDAAERYHLTALITADTWIGGQRPANNDFWSWRDGTQFWDQYPAPGSQLAYNHWTGPSEPNSVRTSRACTQMYPSANDWRWDDVSGCTGNRRFICELANTCGDGFRGPSEQCDDGNVVGGDGCSANCLTATAVCGDGRIYGAETCDDNNGTSGDGCSSSCLIETGYVCPTAGGGCTISCAPGTRTVFSRFPMTTALLATEMAAQPASGPQSSAQNVEYVSCTTNVNAYEAQRRCQSYGTGWNLVRMNSTYENATLPTAVVPGSTFWIGATDEATEAVANFLWRDGTSAAAPTFTAWPGGQPDNAGVGEDCATGNSGGVWNDLSCHGSVGFMCEGPAVCGNGAVAMPEECDDANTNNADSCLNDCTVRFGHACLLPGGNGDASPVVASCPRGASCCYALAQSVVAGVRLVGNELEWSTLSESGTLGFQVSVQRRGAWVALHDGVLPALPDAGQGAVYRLRVGSVRDSAIRIEEHELRGRSLTVYEGTPAFVSGPATLVRTDYSVTANGLLGTPEMSIHAAPSAAGVRKAVGDVPTGVFALASEDGLLRVTFDEIATALAIPVSTVASHVASGELSVREHGNVVAWTRATDDPTAIVFAARRRESVYSATRPYEIRLGAGTQLEVSDRSTGDVATSEARLRFHHEVDSFPALAVSPDPTQEFWFERALGNHASFQSYPATFTLENVDGAAASFDLSYYAAPGLSAENPMTLALTINGQPAGTVDVTSTGLGVARFTLPAGTLEAGPNSVEVRATSTLPAGQALAYVDAYQVTYGAPLEFGTQGRFEAMDSGALAFELDSATGAPVWIVDVTSGERVTATRTDIDATRARFAIDAQDNHEYFVATGEGLMAPVGLRARSEQHFEDRSRAADYVVIAPTALFDAATALAARRQTQGLTTTVVDVQDIYDAYGAGEHDPYAIREFLRVASANWSTAPRYVLLLGDGNYDYRGVRATGSGTIPPMMLQTEAGLYASDFALGDTDGDGRPNIAVGRVPAHTAAEAAAFVQRVVTYESSTLDAFERHALLVSGTNRELDFSGYVDRLEGQLDSRVNAERIDRAQLTLADARNMLIDSINSGSFWFHYQGHGASNQLDDDGLLTLSDVAGLSNANALSIFTGMSCSTARFEVPGMDSISELMLNGSPGGAIALFGPSGPGRSYESGNIAESFQRALLTGDDLVDGRMGDVVLGLYHPTTGANATTEQLSIYLLLGDPATKLPDRSRLAPPPVEPGDDAGVTQPAADGGRPVRPTDPTVPGGALGGGACAVQATSSDATGALVLLMGVVLGLGRRARRRRR